MKVKSSECLLNDKRSIVISDLHGNGHLLERLLQQCAYQPNQDHLILLGDYIEKGKDSLGTLRQIMELSKHTYVDVLMGNCDAIPLQLLSGEDIHGLCHYLNHAPWKGHTLLQEMADLLGLTLSLERDARSCFQTIVHAFPEEFSFLAQLPHVLESEQLLFVHAGLQYERKPYAQDAYTIMKNDRFANQDHVFEKTLICGHTPVINYTTHIPSANPLYDPYKHIYSIDGGCGVKPDGQLNALIIEHNQFSYQYVDDLTTKTVKHSWKAEPQDTHTINWFDRFVAIIKEEGKGVRCIHISSQKEVVLPKSYLYEEHGQLCTKDFSNHHLSVKEHDVVGIIEEWEDEVYVKKDGIYGWIPKWILE